MAVGEALLASRATFALGLRGRAYGTLVGRATRRAREARIYITVTSTGITTQQQSRSASAGLADLAKIKLHFL